MAIPARGFVRDAELASPGRAMLDVTGRWPTSDMRPVRAEQGARRERSKAPAESVTEQSAHK
eukprot:7384437-Prymnesium_polylepis.4